MAVTKVLPILAAAVREKCPWLVSFNSRDYQPGHPDVNVLKPGMFISHYRKQPTYLRFCVLTVKGGPGDQQALLCLGWRGLSTAPELSGKERLSLICRHPGITIGKGNQSSPRGFGCTISASIGSSNQQPRSGIFQV